MKKTFRFSEVDSNDSIFRGLLRDLLLIRKGEFALMRKGRIVDFYKSKIEALDEGERRFSKDHRYSIHRVVAEPSVVGYYWNAEYLGDDKSEKGLHLPENDHHSKHNCAADK